MQSHNETYINNKSRNEAYINNRITDIKTLIDNVSDSEDRVEELRNIADKCITLSDYICDTHVGRYMIIYNTIDPISGHTIHWHKVLGVMSRLEAINIINNNDKYKKSKGVLLREISKERNDKYDALKLYMIIYAKFKLLEFSNYQVPSTWITTIEIMINSIRKELNFEDDWDRIDI